jgi:type VI protein secretion system component VasF
LASFLYSAQRSFQEDEHTRLAQNDYWGTDAGWEQGFFLWIWFFAFAVVSIIALALWLYQICIGKQETALYTNL